MIDSSSQLVKTFAATVVAGTASQTALDPSRVGNDFSILAKSGGDAESYESITINAQTGQVLVAKEIVSGEYVLTVRSVGSYNISQFVVNATGGTGRPKKTG